MNQPDVTLTDFALALESAIFFVLIARLPVPSKLRKPTLVLFLSLSLSALAGGISHGYLYDPSTIAAQACWRATLIFIGGVALSCWWLCSAFLSGRKAYFLTQVALIEFFAYVIFVSTVRQNFGYAILNYLPPVTFLLVVLLWRAREPEMRNALWAAAGLALTFVAAGIQQMKIALHPDYFNHNALYHLVQGIAIALLFIGIKRESNASYDHKITSPNVPR